MAEEPAYRAIGRRKRAERQSRMPKEWILSNPPPPSLMDVRSVPRESGILTAEELRITESYDATALAEAIRSRELTAEAVAVAFCKRATIAQQVCNCLTEIFFSQAIERAKGLDRTYSETGKVVGPLHGVPISLKDTFKVRGYDSSIGIASLAENPAQENSLLVDILLELGAILYCKTGIPQTLMALDSDNNIFGRVLNPRNRKATAGGSSGGEGALLAMRGSVLGVGTDVGGSIRIPAMCNGLYGIKPSAQRIPYVGQENGAKEGASKISITPSAGPMATSLRDCELFLQSVSNSKPWLRDPFVSYGPWESQGGIQTKILLGVIRKDGVIDPLPPINKVLEETVQGLRNAGIEVVEIDAPAFKRSQSLANKFFGLDGGNHMFDLLEETNEPLIEWLSTRLRRGSHTTYEKLVDLHAQKTQVETEMLKMWKDPSSGRAIDAVILPVAPHPVPPIDRFNGVSYTSTFTMLDYPAGTLPIRDIQEADLLGDLPSVRPLSSWDKVNRELWNQDTIDRNLYLNTSLSVQIIAPKLQERTLYQAMKALDDVINSSPFPQKSKL